VSQSGGFRNEYWAYITEYFGSTNYPFMQFTNTVPIKLDQVSFKHLHNHNYNFNQAYSVKLQIDTGSGFTDVGTFRAGPDTNYAVQDIDLGGKILQPGAYKIRWIPLLNNGAPDTNSDWFALLACTLDFTILPETTIALEGTIEWDFKNVVQTGSVATAQGVSSTPKVTGFVSQSGGFRNEYWAHITEYFGSTNYPFIQFTNTVPIKLDQVSFKHLHNHNFNSNRDGYTVKLQIDTGSGFTDVGTFRAGPENTNTVADIDLGGKILQPGTYKIRWIPLLNNGASNTGTDWFALLALTLTFNT
jgi:hypothetical protein